MHKFQSAVIAVASCIASHNLYALNETKDDNKDRIIITGSHIKRIALEPTAPLSILTEEDIGRSSATNLGELLQMTELGNGDFINNQNTNGFSPGTSGFNLRGLRTDRTLVLVDGKRLPSYPFGAEGSVAFIDLNMIPLTEISRVEILKNGASAVYGSDAIGGVVNVITKKEFIQREISIKASQVEKGHYNNQTISYIDGFSSEESEFIAIAELQNTKGLLGEDISISSNLEADEVDLYSYPGTYWLPNTANAGYTLMPSPTCSPENLLDVNLIQTENTENSGQYCINNWAKRRHLIPDNQRISLSLKWQQYFGDDQFYSSFSTNQTNTDSDVNFGLVGDFFQIDNDSPYYPLETGESLYLQRGFTEKGLRNINTFAQNYRIKVGFSGLIDVYDYDISLNHGLTKVKETFENGWMTFDQRTALIQTINNGDINPFEPLTDEIFNTYTQEFKHDGTSKITALNFNFSGEIYLLDKDPIFFALGAEYRKESIEDVFSQEILDGNVVGLGSSSADGDRQINALFSEFSIPATEDLEINLSIRYDDYNDFGSSLNPQLSMSYKPTESLLFRASWGEGFRAPNLFELHSGEVVGSIEFDGVNYPFKNFGNLNLKAETSENISIGTALDLSENMMMTLDYWAIDIEDMISRLSIDTILTFKNENGNLVYDDLITYDNQNNITNVDIPFLNIDSLASEGIDLTLRWDINKSLEWRLEASHLLKLEQKDGALEQVEDFAGEYLYPQDRINTSLIWSQGNFNQSLAAFYIASHGTEESKIKSHPQLNYQLGYQINDHSISFKINNLLDKQPPNNRYLKQSDGSELGTWPYYEQRVYSPIGRHYSLQWRYIF
ncbi:TonB-dependent receptor plug domain-containing protein [Aliikangiella sp. IMCC44359]|uniref:TonB-dependent receptor plug domain-containing protein n=1 Tax=Aliikangiella sp. IMCC44359 TaxID=3459125 RepID=UPI00403B0436